jgi:t-SNARE complex subunit (syntaxin)
MNALHCILILLSLVKPEATPQEIEQAIDSEQVPQIFAHSVMMHRLYNTNFKKANH